MDIYILNIVIQKQKNTGGILGLNTEVTRLIYEKMSFFENLKILKRVMSMIPSKINSRRVSIGTMEGYFYC